MPSLEPGLRFHPTDVELVAFYLRRKVATGQNAQLITEVDLYKHEPWDLPEMSAVSKNADFEWYFFSPRDKKYPNGLRTNRATEAGYWKATGKDRSVKANGCVVGMKKTLVFYQGRAPQGERTNWVMHEYRIEDSECAKMNRPSDSFVVCRVFKKNGVGPRNGEDRGHETYFEEYSAVDEPSLISLDKLMLKSSEAHCQRGAELVPVVTPPSGKEVVIQTRSVSEPEPVATLGEELVATPTLPVENTGVDGNLNVMNTQEMIADYMAYLMESEMVPDIDFPSCEQEELPVGEQVPELDSLSQDSASAEGFPIWEENSLSRMWSDLNSALELDYDHSQTIGAAPLRVGDSEILLEEHFEEAGGLPALVEAPETCRCGPARGRNSRGRQRNSGPEATCDYLEESSSQDLRRASPPLLDHEQDGHSNDYSSSLSHLELNGLYPEELQLESETELDHSAVCDDNPLPLLHEEFYDCSMDGFFTQLSADLQSPDFNSAAASNSIAGQEKPPDLSKSPSESVISGDQLLGSFASQEIDLLESKPLSKPLAGLMKLLGSLPVLPASAAECPEDIILSKPILQHAEVVPTYSSIRVSAVTVTCMSSSDGSQQVQTAVTDCCLQGDVQGVYQQMASKTWQSIPADEACATHNSGKQARLLREIDSTVVASGLQRRVARGSNSGFVFVSILGFLSALFWILLIKGMVFHTPAILKSFL